MKILRKLGRFESDSHTKDMFDSADKDKSGHISFDEFMGLMETSFLKDAVDTGLLANSWIAIQHKTFTRWANNVLR